MQKILNKIAANWIQQNIKKSHTIIKWDHPEMQGWCNIHKSVNLIYNINKMQNKNHVSPQQMQKKHLTNANLFDPLLIVMEIKQK